MAQQTIPDGLWSVIKVALTSNYNELYENKQSPVADDGTLTFLFGDNTLAAQDGNIRFEITADSKINVERYDDSQPVGEEWVQVAVIGSIETDYVDLTGTNPRVFTRTLEGIYNYIRKTQSVPDGIDLGDMDADMYLSSATIPRLIIKTSRDTEVVQSGDSEIYSGTDVCNVTTHTDYGKDIALKIKCSAPTGKMRILIYADETKSEVLYSSHSDWQFNNNGEGFDLVAGLNTIDLGINPITFGGGTETCIGFQSKGDLSVLGETILGEFKIYLERVVTNGTSFKIATEEYADQSASDAVDNIDLSTHNVTELADVTDAGSGAIITDAERTSLSSFALKTNVLELDNTDPFTPDADYKPATKKYVDDHVSCTNTMEITPTANIENLDVSSLSPVGTLFVNNAVNRELKSLSGGVNGDIVNLVHTTEGDLKLKRNDAFIGQMMRMPNNADDTLTKYGGCTLIFNSTTGFWHVIGLYY